MTDKIVYFLRHGEAESNANGFYAGQGDVALTARGIEQAKATAPLLQHIAFDKVYCSDLQRAKSTAALALPHVTYEYTSRIREVDVGALAFKPYDECERLYGETYRQSKAIGDYTPFGGEDRTLLDARIFGFMDELTAKEDCPVIGVVCHGGVIQSAARYVLGSSTGLCMADNCSIAVLEYKDGKWKLRRWNATAEL